MSFKFDFETWWQTPNPATGHPPSSVLDEYTARIAWEAATRSLSVDAVLVAAEEICRTTVEYEADSGDITADRSAEAISDLRLAVTGKLPVTSDTSDELKPCPFCGGDACRSAYYTLGCRNCSIWMSDGNESKWNSRAASLILAPAESSFDRAPQDAMWHAPGMGEVHFHDHSRMIDCQREIDDPNQDYIADDKLAKAVCAALNGAEKVRKAALIEAAGVCESIASDYDHGDSAAIHSRVCAKAILALSERASV